MQLDTAIAQMADPATNGIAEAEAALIKLDDPLLKSQMEDELFSAGVGDAKYLVRER